MGKEPEDPPHQPESQGGDRDKPPPFDPDPRLAAYLEGGSTRDAEKRLRKFIQEQQKKR
jgi:hypothetical protein